MLVDWLGIIIMGALLMHPRARAMSQQLEEAWGRWVPQVPADQVQPAALEALSPLVLKEAIMEGTRIAEAWSGMMRMNRLFKELLMPQAMSQPQPALVLMGPMAEMAEIPAVPRRAALPLEDQQAKEQAMLTRAV
jgi:hypothetical protein